MNRKSRLNRTSESWIATIILVLNLAKLAGKVPLALICRAVTFPARCLGLLLAMDLATARSHAGKVLATKLTHSGYENVTVNKSYEYDHTGRPIKTYHQIGEDASKKVLLAENTYNELGQLIDKGMGSVGESPFLQSVDYRYNIRGWLTNINNSTLTNDSNFTNDESNDFFGMDFTFDKS